MEDLNNNTAVAEQNLLSQSSNEISLYAESELTGVKLQKLGIFLPYFGDNTSEFVSKCSGRSPNSWKEVAKRIHTLDTASDAETHYTDRLYEELELDRIYMPGEIVKCIGLIRRELKLPIAQQDTKWYLDEVAKLFLIEKITDDNVGYSKVIGYKFLFKLKPQA